jgi:hypothetical protein
MTPMLHTVTKPFDVSPSLHRCDVTTTHFDPTSDTQADVVGKIQNFRSPIVYTLPAADANGKRESIISILKKHNPRDEFLVKGSSSGVYELLLAKFNEGVETSEKYESISFDTNQWGAYVDTLHVENCESVTVGDYVKVTLVLTVILVRPTTANADMWLRMESVTE